MRSWLPTPAASQILGLPQARLIDRIRPPRWRTRRPDGSEFPAAEFPGRRAIETGEAQLGIVMGFDRADGTARWVEVNSRPLCQAAGEAPFAVVSSLQDVTDLQVAEQRQRLVLEHAVGGYVILTDDGEILDRSTSLREWRDRRPRSRSILGYADIHPNDRPIAQDLIQQAKSEPGPRIAANCVVSTTLGAHAGSNSVSPTAGLIRLSME